MQHHVKSPSSQKQATVAQLGLQDYPGIPLAFIFDEFQIGGFGLGNDLQAGEQKTKCKKNPEPYQYFLL
jgi:hypothetical protein